jgi:16S rRNA (adenine1518-N6/adenine1519-N6)-dimethyltransferase
VRAYLLSHGIRPRKRWGQNFLVNPRIPERMLARWDLSGEIGVMEIGAGAGALTLPLLAQGQRVVAVERDPRLCALLRERVTAAGFRDRLRLLEADVLTLDAAESVAGMEGPSRWVLVGNLPYAITTPILEWTIRAMGCFTWVSYMVQREYAARILAAPRSGAYGSLTLWVGYRFRAEREMAVGASNFWPMPKVDSVVLRLTPHEVPPVAVPSAADLETVVRAAFSHRRKVLSGSLARGLAMPRERIAEALGAAGIDRRRRAEECTLEQFAALTRNLMVERTEKGGEGWQRKG